MSTIQGDRAYGVLPGFWFGPCPHTPAQRVWSTCSCEWPRPVTRPLDGTRAQWEDQGNAGQSTRITGRAASYCETRREAG
jgi:hypothetical protein